MDLSEITEGAVRRHPWEVSRFRFFRRVLEEHGRLGDAHATLDAGAGDGWFSAQLLRELPDDGSITCWDAHYTAEQLATFGTRGARQTFTTKLPERRFDLLLLLDVLEHVEDDVAFLAPLVDALEPGASALISVPAWQALYTDHDRRLRHYRRYAPAEAEAVLARAGLTIVARGGLFHALLVARGWEWVKENLGVAVDDAAAENLGTWRHGPLITSAVEAALALDNGLSHFLQRRAIEAPGLSWWALCRKPSS